jgi:ketosteroid isomerase-like protein
MSTTAAMMTPPLQDRLEIDALVNEYAWMLDHHQWHDVAGLLTDDAVLTLRGRTLDAPAGIAQWAEQRAARKERKTQHQMTNLRIEVTGEDRARGVATVVLHVAKHGGGSYVDLVGEYRDEYVRTAGGWRFSSRQLVKVEDF